VVAVQNDLVTIEALPGAALTKNEVVYLCPPARDGEAERRLKAELLTIRGKLAVAQVFESTVGVGVGDPVEQTGELLSVTLGPGLLGTVYDGLQNPLPTLASDFGTFLPSGVNVPPLDPQTKWSFLPRRRIGDQVRAGEVLGTVQEGAFTHGIMAPFDLHGTARITWIQQGPISIDVAVARLTSADGREREITLTQRWPVRRPVSDGLLAAGLAERLYPAEPLVTSQRIVDTLFPIAKGGTACIPGPFGAGKTVLQNLISRYANVDVVIIVACGERAGEVVETITEFPLLSDPHGQGSLMDRTVIICNTSSMPVAAREASMYTGITIGEYYRQMGYDVLLIADSTSRWAQAIRETSGRMEEIPGEEAFPAYLDSAIRALYERAGVLRNSGGAMGSLTMIGTVSPAGGNFEEPVTQSTLATVKAFLGLSADRAQKRYYPAIDPLLSWSRYEQQLADWYREHFDEHWQPQAAALRDLLRRGQRVAQMMQVTGEEGITLDEYVTYEKALFVDLVYLQQDAFDAVDASTPLSRQRQMLNLVSRLTARDYRFASKAEARERFTRLTSLARNLNYAAAGSAAFKEYLEEIERCADPQAMVTSAER
jgi:V/A-type H+-transporting ATPase subunit A